MSGHYRRLCKAVTKNDVDEVDFLLNVEKVDPNPTAHYRTSPLWIAFKKNNLEIIKLLITNQINPADPNILGINLLHEAVIAENATVVEILLKTGANPNIAGNTCFLPMYHAIDAGNLQIVELLLQYGADWKPYLIENAARGNNYDVLELLLQHAYSKDLLSGHTWSLIGATILHHDIHFLNILLRWGIFTHVLVPSHNCGVYKCAAVLGMTTVMKMLVEVKPQCLQESWAYPNRIQFPVELIKARKHPVRLDILCRTKIIQQLGFKPISKVETLPLPRILKDFVQFKNSKHVKF